jgi:hypothetical protein
VTDGVIEASRASHKIAASTYAISTIFTSVPNITILVPTPSSRITTALATHRFDDLASLARGNTRSKTYLIRTLAGTGWCDRSITHAHFRNAVNHLPTFGTAHQIELLGATLATHMKGHMVSQNKPLEPHLVKQNRARTSKFSADLAQCNVCPKEGRWNHGETCRETKKV